MGGPTIRRDEAVKFPHHTDGSILGLRLISSLSNDVLKKIIGESHGAEGGMPCEYGDANAPYTAAAILLMGGKTNPNWVSMEAHTEAQDRGLVE